ncbi:MAG: alpha-E domain-containing protein, partial [Vicinamibacterales bacterium]
QPQLSLVLDLLVADPTNARSLAFQLVLLADHVEHLPRDKNAPSPTHEQRIIGRMAEALAGADLDVLGQPGPEGECPQLAALLHGLEDDLRGLSDTITHYYFSHGELRVS